LPVVGNVVRRRFAGQSPVRLARRRAWSGHGFGVPHGGGGDQGCPRWRCVASASCAALRTGRRRTGA